MQQDWLGTDQHRDTSGITTCRSQQNVTQPDHHHEDLAVSGKSRAMSQKVVFCLHGSCTATGEDCYANDVMLYLPDATFAAMLLEPEERAILNRVMRDGPSVPASRHSLVIQVARLLDAMLVAALVLPNHHIVHADGEHVPQHFHLLVPDVLSR